MAVPPQNPVDRTIVDVSALNPGRFPHSTRDGSPSPIEPRLNPERFHPSSEGCVARLSERWPTPTMRSWNSVVVFLRDWNALRRVRETA